MIGYRETAHLEITAPVFQRKGVPDLPPSFAARGEQGGLQPDKGSSGKFQRLTLLTIITK